MILPLLQVNCCRKRIHHPHKRQFVWMYEGLPLRSPMMQRSHLSRIQSLRCDSFARRYLGDSENLLCNWCYRYAPQHRRIDGNHPGYLQDGSICTRPIFILWKKTQYDQSLMIGMDFAFSTKGSMVQADSSGLKMHPKSGRWPDRSSGGWWKACLLTSPKLYALPQNKNGAFDLCIM